jgi:hypothetical protein
LHTSVTEILCFSTFVTFSVKQLSINNKCETKLNKKRPHHRHGIAGETKQDAVTMEEFSGPRRNCRWNKCQTAAVGAYRQQRFSWALAFLRLHSAIQEV